MDAVVIGGGITGCAIAYELAGRGLAVALFEKGKVASEASGQSTAAIRAQGRHPSEIPMMLDCLEMWKGLDKELGTTTEFAQGGNLYLARDQADMERFQRSSNLARQAGLDSRMLSPQEVREVVPALSPSYNFLAGMYSPRDGYAGNTAATRAYAVAARERGTTIHEDTSAYRIICSGGRIRGVETQSGVVSAPIVVNAAGVWARILSKQVGVLLPIRIASVTTWETEPVEQVFSPMIRAPRSSARPLADGRLRISDGYYLKGQTDITFDLLDNLPLWYRTLWQFRKQARFRFRPARLLWDLRKSFDSTSPRAFPRDTTPPEDPYGRKRAIHGLVSMFPQLAGTRIERAATGMLDLTPDMRPCLGAAGPEGYYVAAGFSGHGFAMGPVIGKVMADLVVAGRSEYDLSAFDPARFANGKVEPPISWL